MGSSVFWYVLLTAIANPLTIPALPGGVGYFVNRGLIGNVVVISNVITKGSVPHTQTNREIFSYAYI